MKEKKAARRQFFSDMDIPDQYYGVLVRSSIQRGRLVDIKPPRMPDGYHLYTATDIPGENRLSVMGTSIPVFTPYEIQYYGEPLGILVGPDLQTVHELVSEVLIETEKLDPQEFGETFSSSQVIGKRVIFSGDADLALGESTRVHESISEIGPQDHYYAEPLGVLVNVSAKRLEIFCATQWPFHVRSTVSAVLDLDPSEIVVTPTAIAEAMDGKIWYPSLLAAQASLASVLSRKPVKVCFSRQEDFLFSVKSAPVQVRYRSALSETGSLAALSVRILVNAGSYCPLIDEILDRMTISAAGLYSCPNYHVEAYALRTSLPPMGALSGWGEAQVLFALETHLAPIISSLGESPVQWKLLNLIPRGNATITGNEIKDDLHYPELFDRVCSACDFPRKYTSYEFLNVNRSGFRDGPLRGIGVSCGFQGNGFTGNVPSQWGYSVSVTMETDGRVLISTVYHSEALARIITSIAAGILGIEPSLIGFSGENTDTMSASGPETLSSKLTILVPLIEKCCATLQKQRFRQPLPITVKKKWTPARSDGWDGETLKGTPFVSYTPAVCAMEVELDPLTLDSRIRGIWIAIDAGRLYDKKTALTTVRKSVSVALSKILAENIEIRDGKLSPKDSVQYDVLPPSLIPDISVEFLESGGPPRGIGSLAQNLLPSAYSIAIAQILRQKVRSIPLDPETLYRVLAEREADA